MRLNVEEYIILSGMSNACLEVGIFHLNLKKVLFRNTLEHLLDRRRIPDEANRHLQTLRRNIADAALHLKFASLFWGAAMRSDRYHLQKPNI